MAVIIIMKPGRDHVVIKCKGDRSVLMVDFIDDKFESMYKLHVAVSKSHHSFESCLGRVLLEFPFSPLLRDYHSLWCKNEMEVKDKK